MGDGSFAYESILSAQEGPGRSQTQDPLAITRLGAASAAGPCGSPAATRRPIVTCWTEPGRDVPSKTGARRMRRWIAVAAVLVLADCGGGGAVASGGLEPPEKAFERQAHELTDGQADLAYNEIHPAQQALITQAAYQKCATPRGAFTIDRIDIKKVYDEDITIPGTTIVTASKAIIATVTLKLGTVKNPLTSTYHEVLVDGAWRSTIVDTSGNC